MSAQVLDSNILLQIVIAIATVIISGGISYWIATRQGEMAATRYNLRERLRKDHAIELTQTSLETLKNRIPFPNQLIHIWERNGNLSNNKFGLKIEEPFTVDDELILSHIQTGYLELYQQIIVFKRQYNELSDSFLQIYLDMLEHLQKRIPHNFNASQIVRVISESYWSVLDHNSTLEKAITENIEDKTRVRLGSFVTELADYETAQKLCIIINELLPNYFDIIRNVWQDNEYLEKDYSNIRTQFIRIQNNVRAGVTLKGFCSVGREERFE